MPYKSNYEEESNKWNAIVEEKAKLYSDAFSAYNEAIKKQIAGEENFELRIKLSADVKKAENNFISAKRRRTSALSKLQW